MKSHQKKENCCGCGACAEICPLKAVSMVRDREGFCYPQVDRSLCTACGKCRQVCPIKRHESVEGQNLYLGVQAKDKGIRYSSSSGGIFNVLAQHIIRMQGIVYGAGYDGNMSVLHRAVSDQAQLEQVIKTKYVQSSMEGIYSRIEKNLKEDKWVLFCGTPCQAQALILFLKKAYEKLIVVDLVCYGVPSPGIWEDYVKYLEHKHEGKMTGFSFRDKRNADNGHMRSYIIDGIEYVDSLYQDIYCNMYFRNYILRPSCHSCKFCSVSRNSDFTIGDFWALDRVRPDMEDGMGTSMIIVHSGKARRIWNEIEQELDWFVCKKEELLQPRLLGPTSRARIRWAFLLLYKCMPFWIMAKLMER
ncbi:MAG: Coenzyme F420 hydrogenase/dehydrogenase, beta subunit C-terminal domain [Lachnospiraceae bacterium]